MQGHARTRLVAIDKARVRREAGKSRLGGRLPGQPAEYRSALQREVLATLEPTFLAGQSAEGIERFAFYERTRSAFAIVLTGEQQPFGNFLLRKGVIGETLRP